MRIEAFALCLSLVCVGSCGKPAAAPPISAREVLVRHYGPDVVLKSKSVADGLVCGYASAPTVAGDFAFMVEGDQLTLFSTSPKAFERCNAAFVAPRIVAPVVD